MKKNGIQQIKKLFILFFAVCSIFPAESSAAGRQWKLTVHMTNVPMERVMNEIERQTSYLFIADEQIDITRKVQVDITEGTLEETLRQMLRGTRIEYSISKANIILSPAAPLKPVTVTGIVRDQNGNPIPGAAVIVKGTALGTTTGTDGSFSIYLAEPTPETVLVANFLGYETLESPLGSRSEFDLTLRESSVEMDSVVVTALGIKRAEKALSYNVQTVAQESITRVKDVNFVNALSGKVAGLNINASSSGVGGASKVIMRGTKSIEQSSNALYVIDGIPMYNFTAEGGKEFDSTGVTEAIADINPEDIESVSVLTGAAAAALYGSSAANGAIVITTKKGAVGRMQVTVTSNTEVMTPFVLPEFQNRYGTGDLNSKVEAVDKSWGRRLNKYNFQGYDPASDYFQTGVTGTETVSVSRGTERNQTYFSAGAVNSRGIVPNNGYERYNFTFRNTANLIDGVLTLDLSASYILQKDRNMVNQGVYMNPLTSAYLFPRGNDWNDIRRYERWDAGRGIYTQYWPSGAGNYVMQNPYWVNYRDLRDTDKDRYMLSANLQWKPLEWLSISGRVRIDNSVSLYTERYFASTNNQLTELSKNGLYGETDTRDKQTYGDALLDINKSFGDDWTLHANIGASFTDMRLRATKVRGPIRDGDNGDTTTGIPNEFNLAQLSDLKTVREQDGWHDQTQSLFASAEIGYKGTYYLTLTGRNDWPSQLAGPGSKNSSFFYPSIGASIVLSQLFDMPENFSYLKLRGSYASVGLAFARFLANPTYEWDNDSKTWVGKTNYPVRDLKPERTKSWEIGLTARFLKHFNLDVTYYNTKTINQTFNPGISPGSGYSDIYIQSGDVLNQGMELALGYSNRWRDFSWSSNFTASFNRNEILSLASNAYNPITGEKFSIDQLNMGGLGQTRFILREGGTLGDIYSTADLKRDSNGKIYINESGDVEAVMGITDVGKWTKLGSVLPKANLAWRNDFSWRNLSFGFLVSARLGGVVFSRTQAAMDYYGVSEATAAARDAGGVWINGGENLIDANKWYSTIANQDGISQYYTYDATNIRLQEASISYTIPRKKLGGLCDITLSLVGRNLWMIYNKAPFDPETVATTGNYYQGIDYFMMPSTRNIGFNVRLKF